jgi:hypothetical protein
MALPVWIGNLASYRSPSRLLGLRVPGAALLYWQLPLLACLTAPAMQS